MANRPVSSSERKGVLIVAAIAMIVTLSGLGVAWCGRPERSIAPQDVEVLVDGDTAGTVGADVPYVAPDSGARRHRRRGYDGRHDSLDHAIPGKKETGGKRKNKKEKERKNYGRRSPLDERV